MKLVKLGDNGTDVQKLQKLLKSQGIGVVENGQFLKPTHDALVTFQRTKGLTPDGIAGPRTWAALEAKPDQKESLPNWMRIAQTQIGVKEIKGAKHNVKIVEYLRSTTNSDLGDTYRGKDETAWCAAFVNWCLIQAGLPAKRDALARRWQDYGYGVDIETAPVGAVTIIQSGKKTDKATGSTTGFHIGFLGSISSNHVQLLGGNQQDSVRYSSFNRNTYIVHATRWPAPLAEHKRGCTMIA